MKIDLVDDSYKYSRERAVKNPLKKKQDVFFKKYTLLCLLNSKFELFYWNNQTKDE